MNETHLISKSNQTETDKASSTIDDEVASNNKVRFSENSVEVIFKFFFYY